MTYDKISAESSGLTSIAEKPTEVSTAKATQVKSKKHKPLWVSTVALTCAVAIVAGIVLLSSLLKSGDGTKRYTEVVFTEKYMFYIDSEDDNIYRCDHDGKNVVKLTNNSGCWDLYTYKNSLYYVGTANGYNYDNMETPSGIRPSGLFKLEDDGSDCYAVDLNIAEDYFFCDDYVYSTESVYCPPEHYSYVYRNKIDNVATDNTNSPFITTCAEDGYIVSIFLIENDWIYFEYRVTHDYSDTVARMPLDGDADGNDLQIGTFNISGTDLTIYDNKIYYRKLVDIDNSQLKRTDTDGTAEQLIINDLISDFVIADDVIYYINNDDEKSIYRVNLDGTKRMQLNTTACDGIYIYGDRIYFTDLYDHGYFYSMKLDGSDCKVVIEDNKEFIEATDYKTKGIDDVVAVKKEK